MISDKTIQEILGRADIVEIIGAFVDLKASGPNNKGCCPFHSEKTPSFNVNSVRQTYHCFGCGKGGDVFDFFQEMEGLSFPEAVRRVGDLVDVKVEDRELTPEERKIALEQGRIAEINDLAYEFFRCNFLRENIPGSPIAQELQKMGIDDDLARELGFGYVPDQWDSLMKHLADQGIATNEMIAAGLLQQKKSKKGYYDMLRNRLPFPVKDSDGRIVAFIGKSLDPNTKLKFLCTSNSSAFDRERCLIGISEARAAIRKKGAVIFVQRLVDFFVLRKAGIDNVVATCGGPLNNYHADQLKKLATKAYLLYTQNAWSPERAFKDMEPLLERGFSVAGVSVGENAVVSNVLKSSGLEGLEALLSQGTPLLETYVRTTLNNIDPVDNQPPAQIVKEIIEKVRLVPSVIEKALYAKEIASLTPFRESDLISAALEGAI